MALEKMQFLFYSFKFPFFLLLLLFYQLIDALTLFTVISPNTLIIFSGKAGVGKQRLLSETACLSDGTPHNLSTLPVVLAFPHSLMRKLVLRVKK